MRALLSIDYTNDFVATNGKLTTGEAGQAIEQELTRETSLFLRLMVMIQAINTILKISFFHHIM
jgi:nicotinamidase-related amidase